MTPKDIRPRMTFASASDKAYVEINGIYTELSMTGEREHLPIEGKKLAWGFNTVDFPGKVEVQFVTFNKELIPLSLFEATTFQLINHTDPRIKHFLELMQGPDRR